MHTPAGSPSPTSNLSSFEVLEIDGNNTYLEPNFHDVAIVGLSCRTAGGNNTPEQLWSFLIDKKHASGEVPRHRWEPWLQRDPRNARILQKIIRKGYFLDNLEDFDASFFGISPKEAELMDPHQRLGLELAWESLENAGINPKSLAGSDTAVYIGVDSDDYSRMLLEDLPNVEAWSGINTAYHGIPNRISYYLDLKGPSTAVDAACASSLIAIHLAYQAIISGESTIAICGGVNVICAPGLTHMLQKAGALSPDGVCRSFDDQASGYGRGEGGAIVLLKKLSTALADNDNILAILKGTASAQDGKTNGIMAPNAEAQEMVARQALFRAGDIDPRTIGYVEAHATSTSLGDPTEIGAIAKVFGARRTKDNVCFVGSIKPNIGHLEAAAGAVGFVKAVLSVHKAELAPQTLLETLNKKIDWEDSGLEVLREKRAWPQADGPRRASVCCYGYGGSVCCAVLQEAPTTNTSILDPSHTKSQHDLITLVLSAHQERRLAGHAASLAGWLRAEGRSEDLRSIARTLSQRRAAHDFRVGFVVAHHEEAVEVLTSFANARPSQWAISNASLSRDVRKDVVWVFSGHGAQWSDMGKDLITDSVFYDAIAPLDIIIQSEMEFSALRALEQGDIEGSPRVQVLTYVVQIGLTEVLKSKGVCPQAIIGHSVGEIAASVAAGCLTPAEGALIVSRRAKLYAQLQGQGAMAMVNLPFGQVDEELRGRRDVIAAINSSPTSCVVSGDVLSVESYVSDMGKRGIKTWEVKTDIAFHSPTLESLVAPLQQGLQTAISPRPANVPIYSTSDPNPQTTALRDNMYWSQNMISPVRLVEAVEAAMEDGFRFFLEVSSHPIISHSISETLAARSFPESAVFGVMKRGTSPARSILCAVAHLHTLGAHVDFGAQLGRSPWCANVPNTPWVHKHFWKTVTSAASSVTQQHDVDKHTLLGGIIEIAGSGIKVWTTILDNETKPYPLIHPLDNTEIVPAAVYCNTFLEATRATILNDIKLRVPLPITADQREVQVVIQGYDVRLLSRLQVTNKTPGGDAAEHTWIEHSTATFKQTDMTSYQQKLSIPDIKKRMNNQLPINFAWEYLQKIGVSGIAFPWAVLEHHGNEAEMLVKIDTCPDFEKVVTWNEKSWAPFLDAATSVGSSIFFKSVRMRIVSGIEQVLILSNLFPPKIGWLFIQQVSEGKDLKANISILDGNGTLLVEVKRMQFSDVEAVHNRSLGVNKLVHRLAWIPAPFSEMPLSLRNIVLVSIDNQLATRYAETLMPIAQKVVLVSSSKDLQIPKLVKVLEEWDTLVIYIPGVVEHMDDVAQKAHAFVWESTNILKTLVVSSSSPKLFVITVDTQLSPAPAALAHAPLCGFARIAASEYPEQWGGLIDNEGAAFPLLALKYVQGQSVVRMQDGVPRVPRLRPFLESHQSEQANGNIMPKPHGTYLLTGGLGDLGLHLLEFLVQKGARRIVVVSRRGLPPRKLWSTATGHVKEIVHRIAGLEATGATIHAIALDIGSPSASVQLSECIDALDLPPMLGVVHAAGVSGYGYIKDTTSESFAEVMAPKVRGALTLHEAFPPNTLDFFVLYSSIGQLIGTPGQAAYAASNAFLDTLATHRRLQGCNAVSIQWTAWRGLGLAAETELVDLELESKGVTDISVDEGLQAWEYLSQYNTDQAVVTRTRILDPDEPLPCALIADVVQRRARPIDSSAVERVAAIPESGPALKARLSLKVRQCLSTVLHLGVEDMDDRAAIADLGIDSVMTVALRQQLQKEMGVTVPPTLTWSCPTVGHLVEWFNGRVGK